MWVIANCLSSRLNTVITVKGSRCPAKSATKSHAQSNQSSAVAKASSDTNSPLLWARDVLVMYWMQEMWSACGMRISVGMQ